MKKTIIILCSVGFLILIIGTLLHAQSSPSNEITDKFFELYAKDPNKAVEYGFATNKYMLSKPEVVENVKTQLKALVDQIGTYSGNQVISDHTIGVDLREMKFLVKYDREPIRFTFLLYKPKDKWEVLNFSFNENMDKEIEDAGKGDKK